jgi:cellulose binding protein with CBM2 domain
MRLSRLLAGVGAAVLTAAALAVASATATNLDWNRTLAPNSSTSFGFNGTFTGSNPAPATFTLNGNTCATG